MKCDLCDRIYVCNRRAPQGARGLKFIVVRIMSALILSRPARGAWVEILGHLWRLSPYAVAPRKGRVG